MEISGRVLRDVEFRDRLRGYDTEEVDEFLEKVAVAVDDLLAQLDSAREAATHAAEDPFDDDTLRRTLVLAQRTADLAVKEAKEEAATLLEDARAEAEELVGTSREEAARISSEAQARARETISDLDERKTTLEAEVAELTHFIESLRKQLVFALQGALETVGESLKPPAPTSTSVRQRLEKSSKGGPEEPAHQRPKDSDERVDDISGPPTEAVASAPHEEETTDADAETDSQLSLVEDAAERGDKRSRSRRDEKSTTNRASRRDSESEADLEEMSITGEEAIISVESVVDPDEELWQRWARGSELDTTSASDERPRSMRSASRAERRGGGYSA